MEEKLSVKETDVLLHNVITPSQRDILLKDKNLDFSYNRRR
jgi:hypothetical protein